MPSLLVPLAPLLAVASILVVLANCSLHGVAINAAVVPAALVGLLTAATCLFRASWRELLPAAVAFAIPCLHFLVPAILRSADLILVDAGDFGTYAAVGSWLTSYPITQQADFGAGYNPLQFHVEATQANHQRPGAIFLLAFFALITGREVVEAYTFYSGVLLALQSLSVYALTRVAFPQLRSWMATTAAVLYGVSPVPVWAAMASFLPQTLGLAFVIGAVAVFSVGARQVIQVSGQEDQQLPAAAVVAALALLLFGAWSVYPEGVPFGLAICGFYLIFLGRSRLLAWSVAKRFVVTTLIVVVASMLLSPLSLVWGAKGLIAQLSGIPHGGQQLSTPFHLFGLMVLASQAPLLPDLLLHIGPALQACGYVMWVLGFAGLVSAMLIGDRAMGAAALVSALLLMTVVAFKYRFAAYGWYAAWPSLYTWNLFKAAQYLAPLLSTLALGGLFIAACKLHTVGRLAVVSVVGAASLGVALGQDLQLWSRTYAGVIERDFKRFLERFPKDGRLLIDLDPNTVSAYERYVIYAILRERPSISTHDVQSRALFEPRYADRQASFLSVPISYVLSDRESRFANLALLDRHMSYRLLDARRSTIAFTIDGANVPRRTFISNARGIVIAPPQ